MADKTPGKGHNADLAPEQREALFFHHLGTLARIDARLKDIKEERKRNRLLAKSDGFALVEEIDLGLKLFTTEETKPIIDNIVRRMGVAQYFRLPLDFQMDLFASASADGRARFFDAGLQAGLMGKDGTPPAELVGDQMTAWTEGWQEGQRRLKAAWQSKADATNAEEAAKKAAATKPTAEIVTMPKRGRGRPRKNTEAAPPTGGDQGGEENNAEGEEGGGTPTTDAGADPFPVTAGNA
jgi:hypothetical protein